MTVLLFAGVFTVTPAKEGIVIETKRKNAMKNFGETLIEKSFCVRNGGDCIGRICSRLSLADGSIQCGEVTFFPVNFAVFKLLQISCERAWLLDYR